MSQQSSYPVVSSFLDSDFFMVLRDNGDGTYSNYRATFADSKAAQTVTGLDSLTDVLLTSVSAGSILSYNGTQWVNKLRNAVNTQTASYTLVLGDSFSTVRMNNAAANSLTVPPESAVAFDIGTEIEVIQTGAGLTTIAPGVGVTVNSSAALVSSTQHQKGLLRKVAADTWNFIWIGSGSGSGGGGGGTGGGTVSPTYKGARAVKTASQAVAAGTWTPMTWAQTSRDTNSFWNIANPTRYTIPAGVAKIKLKGAYWTHDGAAANFGASFWKNGAAVEGSASDQSNGGNWAFRSIASDVIDVVAGDYFEFVAFCTSATTVFGGTDTWFAIEVVEGTILNQSVAANTYYDMTCFCGGKPNAGEVIFGLAAPRPFYLPAGATNCYATASTAATASTTFNLKKNGTTFGTVVFSAAGTIAVVTITTQTNFVAGDLLTIVAPGTQDTTCADIAFTLAGTRT